MVTLTSADNVLKQVYLGVVSEQLNTSINPLLGKIKQTTSDVWGKEIRKVAPYGLNGGIGAGDENSTLPTAAGNQYAQFVLDLKNLYGKIEITDKAIRASQNSAGAFVNLLDSEMEGLIRASSFNFGRMLYGDGSGLITKITSNENNAVTVEAVNCLVEGMVVDIVDASGNAASSATGLRIMSIDRANKTVKFATTISGDLAEKYIAVQGSFGKELTGLGAIFKDTGRLYGLDRETYGWMKPFMNNIGEGGLKAIDDMVMQTAIDNVEENANSAIDFIVCSAGVKRNYQNYFTSYRTNVDILDLAGGYKAISYNGIPLVSDRFAPANTMYLLNTKEFALHQLCDWQWLEGEDGRVIKQTANKPSYTATLVKYADIICNLPSGQAMITGILES